MSDKIETRIVEINGRIQGQGTGEIQDTTLFSVEIKGTDGEWHGSGVYQISPIDASRLQEGFENGKPGWFLENWYNKVLNI